MIPRTLPPLIQLRASASPAPLKNAATLLATTGVLRIPPIGVDHAANELTTEARVVGPARDHAALFAQEKSAILAERGFTGDEDEIDYSERADAEASFVRAYLASVVEPAFLAQVEAAIGGVPFDGKAAFYRCVDTNSDIIGDDLLVLTPSGTTEAIVLRLSYVHT